MPMTPSIVAPQSPVAEILNLAGPLSCCGACALDWYRNDAIAEFGGLTAEEMVAFGRWEEVLVFLKAIACGLRG